LFSFFDPFFVVEVGILNVAGEYSVWLFYKTYKQILWPA